MQYKKALILLNILIIIFASNLLIAGAQDNTAIITVLPSVQQATSGQEFTISIQLAQATQIYGASFKLSYDPATFEVVQTDGTNTVVAGTFFEGKPSFTLKNTADAASGSVDYAMTLMQPAEPVSGGGLLGTITFRALKDGVPSDISAVEASLVSPEFADVDGHLVAQRMLQVPAQIVQGSAPSEPSVAAANSNSASVSVAQQPAQPLPARSTGSQAPFVAAGVFFLVGIVLLLLSVGLYRTHLRFNRMTLSEVQPEAY